MKALLIDDDFKLSELLTEYFSGHGIALVSAQHPDRGIEMLRQETPDIVILDVMMPDKDGFTVCREIRSHSDVPIIMLTARGETTDKIVGLELGADDYLAKPFEPRELIARMNSIARRSQGQAKSDELIFGELEIRTTERNVYLNEQTLDLTTMEYELLTYLAENVGKKLSRDEIMNHLQGIDSDVFSRSVDILVSRLRQKLGDDSKKPKYIKTVWGTGYVFHGGAS